MRESRPAQRRQREAEGRAAALRHSDRLQRYHQDAAKLSALARAFLETDG